MGGFPDVAVRISQLQSQLGLRPTQAAATSATSATSAADAADATSFASELAAVQGDTAGTVATGDAAVASAQKYLGVPYVYGGTDPATGLDCSGLVQRAFGDLGVKLPRVAADQAKVGRAIPSLAQAQPGDLLAFGQPVDHIAIYVGNGKMIAAPHTGDKVKIENVYTTPTAIRRVAPPGDPSMVNATRPAGLSVAAGLGSVPYGNLFTQAGAKYGISPKLLAAVARVESNYNPRAVSAAGAQGLMQLMPGTAAGLGVDPLDPGQAVDGAARMLAGLLKQFNSSPLAIAAYNAGAGAVQRYGGIPPFAETQAYVPKVQAAMAALG
jgi:soluble lytic murein transglycosylase-like protein